MFELKMKAKEFKNLLDIVSIIEDEATFLISKNGMNTRTIDPMHGCIISVDCAKMFFSDITVSSEVEKLSFSLGEVLKLFKNVASTDELIMSRGEDGKLRVEFKSKYLKKFAIPLIQQDKELLPMVKTSSDAVIKASTVNLGSVFKDAAVIADEAKLTTKENIFSLSTKSEKGEFEASSDKELGGVISVKASSEVSSTYRLLYLGNVMDACKGFEVATLEYAHLQPLTISFAALSGLSIKFFINALKDKED